MSEKSTPSSQRFEPEELRLYYRRLFPHKQFFRWLNYANSDSKVKIFKHREISFTLKDDIYVRFQSFDGQEDFEAEIISRCPYKIDIGAVYNFPPRNRLIVPSLVPQQHELVFDIDMTDYDAVRTCCRDAAVCGKCWKFLAVAVRVLDAALREDFGYRHLLWVFSGRRGVHCWVCDERARKLSTRGRAAVAEYLNLHSSAGLERGMQKVQLHGNGLHLSVRRALRAVETAFAEVVLADQALFVAADGREKLLVMLPPEVRKEFRAILRPDMDSAQVWNEYVAFAERLRTGTATPASVRRRTRFLLEETQLAFVYPRLDINVSKGLNHLLKAPFCIHPKTGKVCVPFKPGSVDRFDVDAVPTIHQLIDEINEFERNEANASERQEERSRIKDYRKTSLNTSIAVFEEFLRHLEASLREKARDADELLTLEF